MSLRRPHPSGRYRKLGLTPAEHVIRAFGQNRVIAHVLHGLGERVVVDKLGIAEDAWPHAEKGLDALVVQGHLFAEFFGGIEEGQRMVIGFGKQLHAARFHQFPEALDDLGRVALELVERGAGNGEAHLEAALVATDQLEQKSIHGQVALAGHLRAGCRSWRPHPRKRNPARCRKRCNASDGRADGPESKSKSLTYQFPPGTSCA